MQTLTVPSTAISSAPIQPPELTGKLKPHFYESYRQWLAGKQVNEIAKQFGVSRQTVWRWFNQVVSEAETILEASSPKNIIVSECLRLADLELQARKGIENATTDRARVQFMQEARRCVVARCTLLSKAGILPSEPSLIFGIVANERPVSEQAIAGQTRPRAEIIESMIETMRRTEILQRAMS